MKKVKLRKNIKKEINHFFKELKYVTNNKVIKYVGHCLINVVELLDLLSKSGNHEIYELLD